MFTSCNDKEEDDVIEVYGEITIALDVNKDVLRLNEAIAGNFVSDATKEYLESKGKTLDFAIINGGGIRFGEDTRPDGIYPAGDFTAEEADEMFPFGNKIMIVEVTGEELKTIFERSVSALPEREGRFLQVSSELKIEIDSTLQPQTITLDTPPVIVTHGTRITSIKINGVEFDSTATYKLAISDYIASGEDGYVTFANISSEKKEDIGDTFPLSLKYYLEEHSPITPAIEGRITFVE